MVRHKRPEELEHHDCLLYKATGNQIYWEFNKHNKIQRVKMRSKLVCNNGLTLASLCVDGVGIINTPRFFVEEELASGKLVEILADYRQQELDLHIVYPHRRHLSAKVQSLSLILLLGWIYVRQNRKSAVVF